MTDPTPETTTTTTTETETRMVDLAPLDARIDPPAMADAAGEDEGDDLDDDETELLPDPANPLESGGDAGDDDAAPAADEETGT